MTTTIKVFNEVGEYAITLDDGEKIYARIHPLLMAEESVQLDFEQVLIYASPFFNAAIGRLLKDIDRDTLNQKLRFEHLTPVGRMVLKQVIDNAKEYYAVDASTQETYNKIVTENLEES